jgi:hypothetical protein
MAQLALLRIGIGLVLLYVLFVASFDLEAHLGPYGWGGAGALRRLDPYAWPFSVLDWFSHPFWLWAVHLLAALVAASFLIGILPFWSGALSLYFLLSYAHRNPGVVTGLDSLLWMALFYILLTPCGRMFGVNAVPPPEKPSFLAGLEAVPPGPHWEGFPIRVLQLHVSVLYFLGGLDKLNPEWLAGNVFWNPRLVETGIPFAEESLRSAPQWAAVFVYGALLFHLFFPVFVWLPRFRYVALGGALATHLVVALFWGHAPTHVLMVILLVAFVRPDHLDAVVQRTLIQFGWKPPGSRESQ